MEGADSWATDGHKWLQVPYDCGVVMVRDAAALRRAMSVSASYLPQGEARDPADFTPELSRRARGFALWATIRALGREGIAEMVARNCRVARRIAAGLAATPGLEVLNDVVLNQVAVATRDGDAATPGAAGAGAGRGPGLSQRRGLARPGDPAVFGQLGADRRGGRRPDRRGGGRRPGRDCGGAPRERSGR